VLKKISWYTPDLAKVVFFFVLAVFILSSINIFPTLGAHAETTVQNCLGCVNNTKTQVLTIFNFQTEENPFLAGNATFLIMPNPYAYTTNSTDYLDLTTWFNFVVTDNGKFDVDPTPGIIELVGVNNGTYSIMQIKGSPGFGMSPYPEASDDIFGRTGFSYVTQTFVNFTTTSATIDPPLISDEMFSTLQNKGAKINSVTISSSNDLPPAMIVNKNQKMTASPPETVAFTTSFSSNTSPSTVFNTLGIPTYSTPKSLVVSDQSVFIPPVFVAPVLGGGNFMMSPILDEINPGLNMVLRFDNVPQGTTHPLLEAVELPMSTHGTNVGVSLKIDTSNPSGVPIPSGNVVLFIDFQGIGDVDFSDPTSYSIKPTLHFNVEKDGVSCPAVVVYLLDSGHWHEVTPGPQRNPDGDTSHTCAYNIGVEHFSSYLVVRNSEGGHDHGDHTDHSEHTVADHSGHTSHVHGASDNHQGHQDAYSIITKDLNIFEIKYDLSKAVARITIGTTGKINDIDVQIYSMVGGFRMAYLVQGQPQTIQVMGKTMMKYVFEVPLDPQETFFRVSVEDRNYNLNQSVKIDGMIGTVIPWFAGIHDEHRGQDSVDHTMSHTSDTGFEMKFDGVKKTVSYNGVEFPIKYEMAGNINGIEVDEVSKSVTFLLNSVSGGELLLQVPRSLIDATDNNFIVLMTASQQTEINYAITASTPEFYTLDVTLPAGAEKITIVGTNVVPEFDTFAILVFVVALVSIVAYLRTTKNFKFIIN
jgi:predicted secreted protein with PEFG-CTERM motif